MLLRSKKISAWEWIPFHFLAGSNRSPHALTLATITKILVAVEICWMALCHEAQIDASNTSSDERPERTRKRRQDT